MTTNSNEPGPFENIANDPLPSEEDLKTVELEFHDDPNGGDPVMTLKCNDKIFNWLAMSKLLDILRNAIEEEEEEEEENIRKD